MFKRGDCNESGALAMFKRCKDSEALAMFKRSGCDESEALAMFKRCED